MICRPQMLRLPTKKSTLDSLPLQPSLLPLPPSPLLLPPFTPPPLVWNLRPTSLTEEAVLGVVGIEMFPLAVAGNGMSVPPIHTSIYYPVTTRQLLVQRDRQGRIKFMRAIYVERETRYLFFSTSAVVNYAGRGCKDNVEIIVCLSALLDEENILRMIQ